MLWQFKLPAQKTGVFRTGTSSLTKDYGLDRGASLNPTSHLTIVPGAKTFAAKEQGITSGEYRFVIAGHTHTPATELIASDNHGERYYINTGTWRNRIPSTPDFKAFGRLKTLTYVIVYGPDEDTGGDRKAEKLASIDFWSGITQRWHK
jgi:hypothetical protein